MFDIGMVFLIGCFFGGVIGYAVKDLLGIEDADNDIIRVLEEIDNQIDSEAAYNLGVAKVQRVIRDRILDIKRGKIK